MKKEIKQSKETKTEIKMPQDDESKDIQKLILENLGSR